MALEQVKIEVETQLAAISSPDTWQDIIQNFSFEINNIVYGGSTTALRQVLIDEYPTGNWNNLDAIVSTEASNANQFNVEDITIPANGALTLSSVVQFPTLSFWKLSNINAPKLTPTAGFDPDNISTGEAGLIDGNYTNLVYNNSIAGSLNGKIFAVDLGTAQSVSAVTLYDWDSTSGATYMITDGDAVTSTDGTTWTTQVSFINKKFSINPGIQFVFPAVTTARYVGIRYTSGASSSYWALSELEAFGAPSGGDSYIPLGLENEFFTVNQTTNNFDIILTNKGTTPVVLKMRSNRA